MATTTQGSGGFLKSTFPVFVPQHPALTYSPTEFEAFVRQDVKNFHDAAVKLATEAANTAADDATLLTDASVTTTGEVRAAIKGMDLEAKSDASTAEDKEEAQHPFKKALHDTNESTDRDMENMMLTENADLAHRSTTDPLVDLFHDLEEVVSGPRLCELLEAAWQKDPLSTLKIIFNARSIHLGKSSRNTTYKCFGWLAQTHPVTLLVNLQWLARPIIEKKLAEKKEGGDEDDMVLVEAEKDEADPMRHDVKNGVAHGYWKDLLNILALAVEGKLDGFAEPRNLLNIENKKTKKSDIVWEADKARGLRQQQKADRHTAAIREYKEDPFYRALHLTVARLFADQLKTDLALLHSNDKKATRQISLCAKWAPSIGLFHDKHTFIVSSIAEILHPQIEFNNVADRELYLRHAREAYRKDISALRKALEVVERDVAAESFANIKYERVPSLAMSQYSSLFAKKDTQRFDAYITKVAEGKKSISGATLLPSKLVAAVRKTQSRYWRPSQPVTKAAKNGGAKALVQSKMADMEAKVLDGQWKTLVQRIRDSGKIENSIAVADVSGSMTSPFFPDGTTPIDSAIGLSLLLAEITAAPFGGSFITFSENPHVNKVEGDTFQEKVANLEKAEWGMSTDFVAVFEKLILPVARKHKVTQEDMVKQVFVFSDMQFNSAGSTDRWSTSYERVKFQFELAGYEMPKLVFWNLAGGRAGVTGHGDPTAPKPVTAEEEGTALVSGYSQGMLKVFLDNGAFEDPEAEEEIVEEEGDDGETVQVSKKQKMDPMSTVRKAISHKAYSMLQVVD